MELLGYSREEFLGKELWEIGLLKDEDASINAFEELQKNGYIRYEDLPLETKAGRRREVEFVSNVYSEGNRQVIQCNIRDITLRKSLERKTYNLAAIVESSNDAIVSNSFDGTILTWNRAAETIFGYREEEIVGQNIAILFPPDQLAESEELSQRIKRGELIQDYETTRLRKDGSSIPVFLSHSPIKTLTGETIAISKIAHDISNRKFSEKALEEAAKRERAMIEHSLDVICTMDAEGRFVSVSPASLKVWGYRPEDLIGRRYIELVVPEDVPKTNEVALEIISGVEVANFENRYIHKNGSRINVGWTAFWSDDDSLMFCVAHDITSTKELEEKLRQSQKLESVGLLAGGIAHDFNNMLTAINGYSDLTLRQLKQDDPLRRNIEEIKKAGLRSATLTHQLLAFSRQQVLQPVVVDLNEIIAETITMLQRLIGEDIELNTKLNPRVGRVKVDPGQFSQMLMNLSINARDAMPHGGKLTIESSNVFLEPGYATREIGVLPGAYVLLTVSDTGTGMNEETIRNIFDPFFTTKAFGQGTGLGLATVYGIVNQSGGNVKVYSELEIGTTFKVYLPRVVPEVDQINSKKAVTQVPMGTETILLVEDEEMVRNLSREILETYGYTVVEARNGSEALEIYDKGDSKFDLVMTDVVMPKMGGRELADKLVKKQQNLEILFTSGYTDDAVVRHGVIESNANFIQKPFSPAALVNKIREILN